MIDRKTIDHIAKLSRLEVGEKQAQEYSEQLSKILGYFEQISKVDTHNVEPLVTPSDIESYWRDDVAVKVGTGEEMVANAPERVGNLFKVPPVV